MADPIAIGGTSLVARLIATRDAVATITGTVAATARLTGRTDAIATTAESELT